MGTRLARIPFGGFSRQEGRAAVCCGFLVLMLWGCSLEEGFSGLPPPGDLLLATQGCAKQAVQEFTVMVPEGVPLLDLTLEVFRTQIDVALGAGKFPQNYFSFGPRPGLQKVRVGQTSYRPLTPGNWVVRLSSLAGETEECEPDASPDWRLRVSRAVTTPGVLLLEETCESPACEVPRCDLPGNCPSRLVTLDLPEDAVFLEVVLESLQGDADIWLRTANGEDLLGSANPGPGFDILEAGAETCAALRGQTLTLALESWAEATPGYRLSVFYLPGQI